MVANFSEKVTTERVWRKAVDMGAFTTHELSSKARFCHRRVGLLINTWEQERLVERQPEPGPNGRVIFRMINDGKVPRGVDIAHERAESLHGNMWTAMRGRRTFTARDIAAQASTPKTEVTLKDAATYCRMLAQGLEAHLKPIKKAVPGVTEPQYRLVRNTGPKPPKQRRVRATYDPNLEEFTFIAGGDA